MSKLTFIFIAIIGGLMGGMQAPINGALGKKVGGFEGALISFSIGTLFLIFIVLFFGKGNVLHIFSVPKWQLVGGFLGAVFVTGIILAVPNIGAASAIFAAILGQMVISVLIDHFGFFGVDRIPIDWSRFIGILFMAAGLYFIFRGNLTT
jgi:transporter family-2 protein